MKNYIIAVMIMVSTISSAMAQYGWRDYDYNDDRYYYDNDFDWHWDIRVRISDGIQRGLITRNESNFLYRRLEDLERKEYAYQSDGFYSGWEQQEVWDDVIFLNRKVGIELYDYDRTFYGFEARGCDRRGYSRWFYQGGYDFYRFDKRGFGSITIGYAPRPSYRGWYRNDRNQVARRYYSERSRFDNHSNNNGRRNHDNRRNHGSRYDDRDSQGGRYSQERRGDRPNWTEPNNRPDNGGNFPQGRRDDDRANRIEPNNGGNFPQGRRDDRPSNGSPDNRGGGRSPERRGRD
jgi:hypothetical protein